MTRLLSKHIEKDVKYVCGIESGGSYYASAVADLEDKKSLDFIGSLVDNKF